MESILQGVSMTWSKYVSELNRIVTGDLRLDKKEMQSYFESKWFQRLQVSVEKQTDEPLRRKAVAAVGLLGPLVCRECGTPTFHRLLLHIQVKKGVASYKPYRCQACFLTSIRQTGSEHWTNRHPEKMLEVQSRIKRYEGDEHPMRKNPEVKARVFDTIRKRHGGVGNASISIRKKAERTSLERYGYKNPMQSPEVYTRVQETHAAKGHYVGKGAKERRRKWEATREANAGPDWRKIDMDRLIKARYKRKPVQMSDGRTLQLQGYEPIAVDWLLSKGIDSKRVHVPDAVLMPSGRYYFPDLGLKGSDWVIEVKSTYTAGLLERNRGLFYATRKKAAACHAAGLRHVLIVCDAKRVLGVVHSIHTKGIREVRSALRE